MEILKNLGDHLKDDYNLKTTKNSRRMLRNLGVSTYIPHAVAMEALCGSELHPVKYLTAIKNYITQKEEKSNDCMQSIHKHDHIVVTEDNTRIYIKY